MPLFYYDPVSGKEIDAKVPEGKFRVVGVDSFDRDSRGIYYGDFDTLPQAQDKAREITREENYFVAYLWDDQARLVDKIGKY